MEVFQLKAITELDDDRYIYHIAIPFGSSQYIVQYWVERVNGAGHTINISQASISITVEIGGFFTLVSFELNFR